MADHTYWTLLERIINDGIAAATRDYKNGSDKLKGSVAGFESCRGREAQQLIGRDLRPEETVHHKNGVRDDNRPSNLELWAGAHPRGCRIPDLIAWAREIIDIYGEDVTIWSN